MSFLNESFWLAISFVIFLYFAFRPIKKAILDSLDNKISQIKKQVEEATAIKKEAELLLSQTKNEMAKLGELKEQMLNAAKAESLKIIDDRTKEMELKLNKKREEALNNINTSKLQAEKQLKTEFIESVIKVVKEYFKISNNNGLSDSEIAERFINKK